MQGLLPFVLPGLLWCRCLACKNVSWSNNSECQALSRFRPSSWVWSQQSLERMVEGHQKPQVFGPLPWCSTATGRIQCGPCWFCRDRGAVPLHAYSDEMQSNLRITATCSQPRSPKGVIEQLMLDWYSCEPRSNWQLASVLVCSFSLNYQANLLKQRGPRTVSCMDNKSLPPQQACCRKPQASELNPVL